MDQPIMILGFAGSLRKSSYNKALLRAAVELVPEDAKLEMTEAIALSPALLEHPDEFAKMLRHYAVKQPVSAPSLYVETVLQNLPPAAHRLKSVRLRALSDARVADAFEDYFAGRRHLVAPQLLMALRGGPSWLTNRGAVSIFLRSLPAVLGWERVAG